MPKIERNVRRLWPNSRNDAGQFTHPYPQPAPGTPAPVSAPGAPPLQHVGNYVGGVPAPGALGVAGQLNHPRNDTALPWIQLRVTNVRPVGNRHVFDIRV